MKKLVKKSVSNTISAYKSCKCKTIKCMSTAYGMGSACTNAMQAAQSQTTRYN